MVEDLFDHFRNWSLHLKAVNETLKFIEGLKPIIIHSFCNKTRKNQNDQKKNQNDQIKMII